MVKDCEFKKRESLIGLTPYTNASLIFEFGNSVFFRLKNVPFHVFHKKKLIDKIEMNDLIILIELIEIFEVIEIIG